MLGSYVLRPGASPSSAPSAVLPSKPESFVNTAQDILLVHLGAGEGGGGVPCVTTPRHPTPLCTTPCHPFPPRVTPSHPVSLAASQVRDTNGWCPYCERVWIALEEKGLKYDTLLIDLYNKPDWWVSWNAPQQ